MNFAPQPPEVRSRIGGIGPVPEERVGGRGILDPSTGKPIAVARDASARTVERIVAAAAAAQPGWNRMGLTARIDLLGRLADGIEARSEEIARVESENSGMTLRGARGDVEDALRALRRWPELLPDGLRSGILGPVAARDDAGRYAVQYEPFGVVARLVAFNHPFLFAVKGTAAALLAGNAVVVKPADPTPMSAMLLMDIVDEVLPPGVFSVVVGDWAAGDALVRDPRIRRIAFTGSTETGLAIQRAAAEVNVKSVSLELGGKNALVICSDADLEGIGRRIVDAMSLTTVQGQSCGSLSRVFAHRDVYERVLDELVDAVSRLRLGSALDEEADVGPMVSEGHRSRVLGILRDAVAAGARVAVGGAADPRVPEAGCFVAPTVLVGLSDRNPAAVREIFGPVISLFCWDTEDEVIRRANALPYGLTAAVWSSDVERAAGIASRLEAGYVWINHSATHHFGRPFGGWKDSGIGREECESEFFGYLQTRVVHFPTMS